MGRNHLLTNRSHSCTDGRLRGTNVDVHTKDGTLHKLHQLLKAMKRSGLSLVDTAMAVVTPPLSSQKADPTPSRFMLPGFCVPCYFPSIQLPIHLYIIQRKIPTPVSSLALPPSSFLSLSVPASCSPPPHPKGTPYPSPTQTLPLHLPRQLLVASDIFSLFMCVL